MLLYRPGVLAHVLIFLLLRPHSANFPQHLAHASPVLDQHCDSDLRRNGSGFDTSDDQDR
jgi:hypothetical protein